MIKILLASKNFFRQFLCPFHRLYSFLMTYCSFFMTSFSGHIWNMSYSRPKLEIFPRILCSFSGKSYLETTIWMLKPLTARRLFFSFMPLLGIFSKYKVQNSDSKLLEFYRTFSFYICNLFGSMLRILSFISYYTSKSLSLTI